MKKNGRLSFQGGAIEATDGRGRSRTISLADGAGPYHFVYGDTWGTRADFALVDASGYAVVLIDLKCFAHDDIMRFQKATGMDSEDATAQPPTRADTLSLVNPPYLKRAGWAFVPGALAFGTGSVGHNNLLIFGITGPAAVIMCVMLLLAKTSMPGEKEVKDEWMRTKADADATLADADAYLRDHPSATDPPPSDGG